jgi:hypothetical protein
MPLSRLLRPMSIGLLLLALGLGFSGSNVLAQTGSPVPVVPTETSIPAQQDVVPAAVTDASVDFEGADPSLYDHSTGLGGGTHANSDNIESLNGGDFHCGDIVAFLNYISDIEGSGTFTWQNIFSKSNTGAGGPVGFGAVTGAAAIISAQINPGDTDNVGLDGDEVVGLIAGADATDLIASLSVTNLEPGETIVVRVMVRLECLGGGAEGTVHSSAEGTGTGGQTVPLQNPGEVVQDTPTPTNTPTDTPTNTPTDTPTNTPTDTPTSTPTDTPTNTPTGTLSPTDTPTETPTETVPPPTKPTRPTHTAVPTGTALPGLPNTGTGTGGMRTGQAVLMLLGLALLGLGAIGFRRNQAAK